MLAHIIPNSIFLVPSTFGMKGFLCDEWDKTQRLKRGGGQSLVSFDAQMAEDRYRLEPVDELTPERVFERSWAMTLLDCAACRLREEYVASGRADLYEQLLSSG